MVRRATRRSSRAGAQLADDLLVLELTVELERLVEVDHRFTHRERGRAERWRSINDSDPVMHDARERLRVARFDVVDGELVISDG